MCSKHAGSSHRQSIVVLSRDLIRFHQWNTHLLIWRYSLLAYQLRNRFLNQCNTPTNDAFFSLTRSALIGDGISVCFLQGPGPIDNLAFTSGDTPPPRKGLPLVPYVSKQVRECRCVSCLDTMISHCIVYFSIVCVIKLVTTILILTIGAEILASYLMFSPCQFNLTHHPRCLHLP